MFTHEDQRMGALEARFRELHLVRMGGSRGDMTEFVSAERKRWEAVIHGLNVTMD